MMTLSDFTRWIRGRVGKGSLPLLLLLCATTACGRSSATESAYQPIRSPYPTFTPTAIVVAQTDLQPAPVVENTPPADAPPATPMSAATVAPTDTVASEPTAAAALPRLVVNAPLVNVRSGPNTTSEVLTTVERGQEYDIVGKNAAGDWWHFCCIDGNPAWVNNELVDIDGPVESVPVIDETSSAAPAPTPEPVAAATVAPAATSAPAEPATEPEPAAEEATPPPPAPEFAFELVSAEQFAEPKVVRVFLYVYDGDQALEGYTIQVKKDGAAQTVGGTSNGQYGFTWPIANTRQRFQNMKVEFPNVVASGVWEIQLVDSGGNPAGPATTFTLTANDANQELYVRYKKR